MVDRTKENTNNNKITAAAFKQFTQYFQKRGEGRKIIGKKNQLIFYSSIRAREGARKYC